MSSTPPDLLYSLPDDFPRDRYVATLRLLQRVQTNDQDLIGLARQCLMGLNGIAFRFRLCAEADLAFSDVDRQFGNNPTHDAYVQRANHLYVFFLSGLSVIESLVYAVHAMPAISGNLAFPMKTVDDQQAITLGQTVKRLRDQYPTAPITRALDSLQTNREFLRWLGIRNIFAHRHPLGETIYVGGREPNVRRFADLATPGKPAKGIPHQVDNILIDANTTSTFRQWLVVQLGHLIEDMASFAESFFGHLPTPP